MGRGYVRSHYGDNCFYRDSSFKRYNRYHGGDTVIFNYNSGNSFNCCGGHGGGGFWRGFGLGIGMGFGNIFGGLYSSLMGRMFNCFGGFGVFGGFGGFGGFGDFSGSPLGGFGWNFGGNYNNSVNTSRNPNNNDGHRIVNQDNAKFATLTTDINTLGARVRDLTSSTLSAFLTDADQLIERIDQALADEDGVQSDDDKTTYRNLKQQVILLKDNASLIAGSTGNGSGTVTIGGNSVNITNITIADINRASGSELDAISDTQALGILRRLDFIDSNGFAILPHNNIRILFLIQKAGVNATVAHNNSSEAVRDGGYIRGKISNLKVGNKDIKDMSADDLNKVGTTEQTDLISYTVDNSAHSGDIGLKYDFKQTSDKSGYNIIKITNSSDAAVYVNNNRTTRVYKPGNTNGPLELDDYQNKGVLISQRSGRNGFTLLAAGDTCQ